MKSYNLDIYKKIKLHLTDFDEVYDNNDNIIDFMGLLGDQQYDLKNNDYP